MLLLVGGQVDHLLRRNAGVHATQRDVVYQRRCDLGDPTFVVELDRQAVEDVGGFIPQERVGDAEFAAGLVENWRLVGRPDPGNLLLRIDLFGRLLGLIGHLIWSSDCCPLPEVMLRASAIRLSHSTSDIPHWDQEWIAITKLIRTSDLSKSLPT